MIWHFWSNKIQALLIFNPHYNPMGSFSNPHISNCSMMPEWHQLVPISGHVEESETAKKLQLYAISIFQVHYIVCQRDYQLNLMYFLTEFLYSILACCSTIQRHIKNHQSLLVGVATHTETNQFQWLLKGARGVHARDYFRGGHWYRPDI